MDNETFDRGQKIRLQLDQMLNQLDSLNVGLSLVWLYTWSVVKSNYESMGEDEDYTKINPEFSIDDVWNEMWENPYGSLEFGAEALEEDIRDWLIKHRFIIEVE